MEKTRDAKTSTIESIPFACGMMTEFGMIQSVNNALVELIQYNKEELEGKHVSQFLLPAYQNRIRGDLQALFSIAQNNHLLPIVLKNGEQRTLSIHFKRLPEIEKPALMLFFITEPKKTLAYLEENKKLKFDLEKTNKTLRTITEHIGDTIWTMSLDLQTTYVSPSVTKVTGFTPEEYKAKTLEELLTKESALFARQAFLNEMQKLLQRSTPDLNYSFSGEYQAFKKNGEIFWADIKVTPIYNEHGRVVAIQGITRDITEKMQALTKEKKHNNDLLYLSNSSLELLDYDEETIFNYITTSLYQLIDNSLVILYRIDPLQRIIHVRQVMGAEQLPKHEQHTLSNNFTDRTFTLTDDLINIFKENALYDYEKKLQAFPLQNNLDVTLRFLQAKLGLHKIYSIGISYGHNILGGLSIFTYNEQDIHNPNLVQILVSHVSTALHRKRLEMELIREKENMEKTLHEKEILLQEVHHRVKNNMAVISGLLKLQSLNITDKQLKNVLKDSQDRIRSMSLVHEKLYQGGNIARINLGDYVKTLITGLISNYKRNFIQLEMQAESIHLDLDTAIPLGLMVNEMITNALKYAFPKPKAYIEGLKEAKIFFQAKQSDSHIQLTIGDNGVGLGKKGEKPHSMGMHLIENMAAQMDATLSLQKEDGLVYHIIFRQPEKNATPRLAE